MTSRVLIWKNPARLTYWMAGKFEVLSKGGKPSMGRKAKYVEEMVTKFIIKMHSAEGKTHLHIFNLMDLLTLIYFT